MIRASQMQQNFSRAATSYDTHARLQQRWRMRVMAHALALFPTPASLLDVGCGTGAFTAHAHDLQLAWRITGLDIAAGMCRVARQHGVVMQGDAACLPLADDCADAVISSLCLQWVPDMAAALRDMLRVTRPGGHAVVMTLAHETLRELRQLAPQLRLLPMRTQVDYTQAVQACGWELVAHDSPIEQEIYPSVSALLRSFRAIGAQAAFDAAPTPWTGTQYRNLVQAYHAQYGVDGGVLASWQPLLLILRKPIP